MAPVAAAVEWGPVRSPGARRQRSLPLPPRGMASVRLRSRGRLLLHRCALDPAPRGSQISTVDPSADTREQARRLGSINPPGGGVKPCGALLAMRRQSFPHIGTAEADEFQAKR